MLVGVIEASEKLASALARIKQRIEKLAVFDEEYVNLADIKRDLERVELYIEDMKAEHLMKEAGCDE